MAEKSPQPQTPGEMFGRRVREERDRQRLSLRELADRVNALGSGLDRSTLARIERGETRGNLDTLFALAAALGVAPIHLMLPREDDAEIKLVGKRRLTAGAARAWIRGVKLLDDSNPSAYVAAMSPAEQERLAHAGISALELFVTSDAEKRKTTTKLRDAVEDVLAEQAITRKRRKRNG